MSYVASFSVRRENDFIPPQILFFEKRIAIVVVETTGKSVKNRSHNDSVAYLHTMLLPRSDKSQMCLRFMKGKYLNKIFVAVLSFCCFNNSYKQALACGPQLNSISSSWLFASCLSECTCQL
jgi:hypothetical protein